MKSNLKLSIATDASDLIGKVLQQKRNGEQKSIAFFSLKPKPSEQKYIT